MILNTTTLKVFLVSLMTVASMTAAAQETEGREIRFLAGGKGLATDFGLEYEKRDGVIGKTFYVQHGKKRDSSNMLAANPEQIVLGAGYAVHLRDSSDFDVYLAPSIALIYQKDVQVDPTSEKDVFTAGPALKIGSLYTMHTVWTIGAEYVMLNNWFSDRIASSQTYGNAVIGYKF